MAAKAANNASTTLASNITNVASSLTVATGTGSLFPAISSPDYFYVTLSDSAATKREIVKVTARSSDTLTITRAQDGTSASAFSSGDYVELRPVAALFDAKVDKEDLYEIRKLVSLRL